MKSSNQITKKQIENREELAVQVAIENRGLRYNRICTYFVHSSGDFGDFCCHDCFRNYNESGGDLDIQEDWGEWHGPRCEQCIAPTSTPKPVTCTLPLKCRVWTCQSRNCWCP